MVASSIASAASACVLLRLAALSSGPIMVAPTEAVLAAVAALTGVASTALAFAAHAAAAQILAWTCHTTPDG